MFKRKKSCSKKTFFERIKLDKNRLFCFQKKKRKSNHEITVLRNRRSCLSTTICSFILIVSESICLHNKQIYPMISYFKNLTIDPLQVMNMMAPLMANSKSLFQKHIMVFKITISADQSLFYLAFQLS